MASLGGSRVNQSDWTPEGGWANYDYSSGIKTDDLVDSEGYIYSNFIVLKKDANPWGVGIFYQLEYIPTKTIIDNI